MPNQPPSWPAAEQHGRKDTQMNYLEVFYAVGTQLSRLVSGRLLTETQIKAASAHAVGKYFADFLPEPKDERAARERVEEAQGHISKATAIIGQLQAELGSQTQQLDTVLKELDEKKKLAHRYSVLAATGQEQFSAFKAEMESALRAELHMQSEKGRRLRRTASAILWIMTLVLGAALGAYFKEVVSWLRTIAA